LGREKGSRRDFIKTTAYVAPAILTLKAAPAFAQTGSGRPTNSGPAPPQGTGGGNPQPPVDPPVKERPPVDPPKERPVDPPTKERPPVDPPGKDRPEPAPDKPDKKR
jgi:hypothetical protein